VSFRVAVSCATSIFESVLIFDILEATLSRSIVFSDGYPEGKGKGGDWRSHAASPITTTVHPASSEGRDRLANRGTSIVVRRLSEQKRFYQWAV